MLPVVISQALVPLLSKPMAHHLLRQKMAEIKSAMAVRNQELNVALTTQLKQFNYDCGAKDMALLRGPRFYNTHIRLQGLELASGGGCSSLGPAVSLLSTAKQDGILFGKFGLTPTPAQFQTEQEMVAYYRAGNNIAYWVLDNSWSHKLLQQPCTNCFYLEFSQKDLKATTIYFPRGDKTIKTEANSHSLSFSDPDTRTQQTIWAGQALEQYAEGKIRLNSLLVGITLGLVLVAPTG